MICSKLQIQSLQKIPRWGNTLRIIFGIIAEWRYEISSTRSDAAVN